MSGQIENIPLHTREPGDEITEADLARLLEATDPVASTAVAAAAAAATQGPAVTFNFEDLFVESMYDDEDEDGEDEEDDEGGDDGGDEVYYNEVMDGWLGPWWASV